MIINLSSDNQIKLEAAGEAALFLGGVAKSVAVPSIPSLYPYTDEETLSLAIQKAQAAKSFGKGKNTFGLAIEDGVISLGNQLFTLSWGALIDETGRLFTASGTRIPIPADSAERIQRDQTYSHVDQAYIEQVLHKSTGAIGLLTSGMSSLKEEYLHIVRILVGQLKQGKNAIQAESFAKAMLQLA